MIRLLLIISIVSALSLPKIKAQVSHNSPDRPARLPKVTIMDTSYIECVYQHVIYDPVLDETKVDFKIIQIGEKISKYSDYGAYKIDSIIAADFSNGITRNEYRRLARIYLPSWEAIIKDFATSNITSYNKVFIDWYVYEEPLPKIEWTLHSSYSTICGYKCRKATASFRGRTWAAWYTSDLSIANGPWKFIGLPGLILKVESLDKEHIFEATSIRKSSRVISLDKLNYSKTVREKYNRELEDYCTRPTVYFGGNNPFPAKDANGNDAYNPNRRLFFNPIELE